jgi:uncharacterized protein (TIGR00299 family) protein
MRQFAIIDPAAGISGDMLLGALIDVGASPEWLRGLPARLGFPEVRIEIASTRRCGIACTKVDVRLASGEAESPSPEYVAPHPHEGSGGGTGWHHHHDGALGHRHLADLLGLVERAPLSLPVRQRVTRAFQRLCDAEGRIHGVAPEAVALHEVGALDALVDIIGAVEGFERLGIDEIYALPVALGNGWVRTSHGVVSVPAPVTTELLAGLDVGPNGPVTGEATTPTGAVLLHVLAAGPPPARYRPTACGWGAGGRDPSHYPNTLRLMIAEPVSEAAQVVTLSSDLDDLSPEYIDPLREALVAAGALDVQTWATQMKKGRPGFRVEATCDTSVVDPVTEAFFLHSTTAGIRRVTSERVTLARHQIEVPAADGLPVTVKVLETPGGPRVKAEFEDVRRAAARVGRPAHDVAREIETQARALLAGSLTGGSLSPKEPG